MKMFQPTSLFVQLVTVVSQSLFLFELVYGQSGSEYCSMNLQCNPVTHTMCKFLERKPSPQCPEVISVGLDEQEMREIVDAHNYYRQLVASGQETRGRPGPQPAATNMQTLTWDNELALIAERWALQCHVNPLQHDTCRHVERFPVGQNIFLSGATSKTDPVLSVQRAVKSWYDEVKFFNRNEVPHYRFSAQTGHYTQLIWADTNKVGCGSVKFNGNYRGFKVIKRLVVCNYGPTGNYVGLPIYQTV